MLNNQQNQRITIQLPTNHYTMFYAVAVARQSYNTTTGRSYSYFGTNELR